MKAEHLSLTEPKLVAAALVCGGKLTRTERAANGRLTFILSGIPNDFTTRILNDEVMVSVRSYIAAMDQVLGLIAAHQRERRAP
jgi:hypothetical protein